MKHILIAVDLQKDFVDGSLGTAEARSMIPGAAAFIRGFDGDIFVTLDTHGPDYLSTAEGRKLPVVHCVKGTEGWKPDSRIAAALEGRPYTAVEKGTFGSRELPALVAAAAGDEPFDVTLLGLCTDICVVSNALLLKAFFPEAPMAVKADCCAGVTPEAHRAALDTMRSCQIDIL